MSAAGRPGAAGSEVVVPLARTASPAQAQPDPAPGAGPGIDMETLTSVLRDLAACVLGEPSLEDIMRQLADGVAAVLRLRGAAVVAPAPGGRSLHLVHGTDPYVQQLERLQERLQDGPSQDSFATRRTVTLSDLESRDVWPGFRQLAEELGIRTAAAVPLLARDEAWGVLDLYRSEPAPFSEEELRVAGMLAHLATSYLVVTQDRDAARRAESLSARRATYDELTGLPVRWVFLEALAQAHARLPRTPGQLAVLFLDLDGLKNVNDTYGHAEGDRLLSTCALRVREVLRPPDVLARLGGDEFVVLLEDVSDGAAAVSVVERIREHLAMPLLLGGREVRPSASIGVALTRDPDTSGAALIARADAAMYRVKRDRRGEPHPVLPLQWGTPPGAGPAGGS